MAMSEIAARAPWWASTGRAVSFIAGTALVAVAASAALSGETPSEQRDRICKPGFAAAGRPSKAQWEQLRRLVYNQAGIPYDHTSGEVDHVVPRCLDGPNTLDNLQFQDWNTARIKDKLEIQTCREYCAGYLTLDAAQARFVKQRR
jgi:hypothetical protein